MKPPQYKNTHIHGHKNSSTFRIVRVTPVPSRIPIPYPYSCPGKGIAAGKIIKPQAAALYFPAESLQWPKSGEIRWNFPATGQLIQHAASTAALHIFQEPLAAGTSSTTTTTRTCPAHFSAFDSLTSSNS
ncbi:hypothetical protein ACLKA6_011681 [Drosophila palustris]